MKTWNWVLLGLVLAAWVGSAQAQSAVKPAGDGTSANPYRISQLGHLVWVSDNVGSSSGKYYTVQNDINAAATAGWGFAPIGDALAPFSGIFDGNGKVISNVVIYRENQYSVGFFGFVNSIGVVKHLSLVGGWVNGKNNVGGLVGWNEGTVDGCYATGSVTGNSLVGGLVGVNGGKVSGSHAAGAASGGGSVGGLAGWNYGTLRGCYATGPVTGGNYIVGGLVGYNTSLVRGCYATGAVSGGSSVGGLVGWNEGASTVINCYATGSVTGSGSEVGGLVGENSGVVNGCYAIGSATGNTRVGGLAGWSYGTVSECYSTGLATGSGYVGGLVGLNEGLVGNAFWDTQTSGQATSSGGAGRTTAQMKQQATFVGWDFVNAWRIIENETYPGFASSPLTYFSISQLVNCTGAGWSRTFVMDLTNFQNLAGQDGYQSYTVNYLLYYNIWTGIYLYDYGAGAFSALTWSINLDL